MGMHLKNDNNKTSHNFNVFFFVVMNYLTLCYYIVLENLVSLV